MLKRRSQPPAEAQDRSEETARHIGRLLRETREARGEELGDIAEFLRVRPGYLAALEAGELAAIPGRPYAIGFLRAYGSYLGLDGDGLVGRLKAAIDHAVAAPDLSYRQPVVEGRRATAAMVTTSLLLAAGVYGGYYALYRADRGAVEQVAEAPGEAARLSTDVLRRGDLAAAAASRPAPPPAAAAPPPVRPGAGQVGQNRVAAATPAQLAAGVLQPLQAREPAAAPVPAADAMSAVAAESRDPATVGPERPRGSTPAPDAAAATAGEIVVLAALEDDRSAAPARAATPARPVATPTEGEARAVLAGLADSMVRVRSRDGEYVRTRRLAAGERMALPNRDDLILSTDNGAGVELLVDGRSRGPVGQRDEIVRDLALRLPTTAARRSGKGRRRAAWPRPSPPSSSSASPPRRARPAPRRRPPTSARSWSTTRSPAPPAGRS